MKGLVVSVPMSSTGDDFHMESEFDEQLLRAWLLFWDKLDWPTSTVPIRVSVPWLEDFLGGVGILQRTVTDVRQSLTNGEVFVTPHLQAFDSIQREPGDWSLAMGERTFRVPETRYAAGPGIEVKITQALPVPSTEVPLDEVLWFKSKRKSELEALRDGIEQIKEQFLDDPARPLAEQAAVTRFVKGAYDHLQAIREAKFSTRLFDLAGRFALKGSATAVVGVAATAAFGGTFPQIVGNSIVAGGIVTVEAALAMATQKPFTSSPYAYVLNYHEHLFPPE